MFELKVADKTDPAVAKTWDIWDIVPQHIQHLYLRPLRYLTLKYFFFVQDSSESTGRNWKFVEFMIYSFVKDDLVSCW